MCLRHVRDHFAVEYPDRPVPSISTISRLVNRLKNTGCIDNRHLKRKRGPNKLNEDKRMDIVLSVLNNKNANSRALAIQHEVILI